MEFERYPVIIETYEYYQIALNHGFFPLKDWRRFTLKYELRKYLEDSIFKVSRNIVQANQRFYNIAWKISNHYCEECGQPLANFRAEFISHILTKGAYPELAHDLRNFNILCRKHHQMWEFDSDRYKMKIYRVNRLATKAMFKDLSNGVER